MSGSEPDVPWPLRPPSWPEGGAGASVAPPSGPQGGSPGPTTATAGAPWAGAHPPAEVRWGMGDVVYGILLWVTGGVLAAVVLIATGVVDLQTGQLGELSVGAVALSLMSGWIGLAGWPVVASYRKGRRSLAADFGLRFAWIDLAWGIGAGFACLAVSVAGNVAWLVLSDQEAPDNAEFLPSSPGLVGGIVLLLLVAVATPVVEELFFRGLFLRSVARRWGPAAGVVVSSVVFGLFHAGGDSLAEAAFIVGVTTVYGAVLGLVATVTGRLGAPIIAHMVVNGVGVGVALLGSA